jgi:acetylornithine deacetylase
VLPPAEQALVESVSIDTVAADTQKLIAARSDNPGVGEAEAVAVLHEMCERIGATVTLQEVQPGRSNLHATMGPVDAPSILFLGHSDVVPAGDGWEGDPFTPRISEEKIIGRGATDMKGGLAAVVAAMGAVSRAHPEIRLELLCTADEEDQALGALAALESLEGRSLTACIVAEPTNLDVVVGCRGSTNLQIDIEGKSAHAGRPEDGASSIYGASVLIEKVREAHRTASRQQPDPLLGRPTWNVGTIAGGTGTSMVPQKTTVTIDRRTMPGEKPQEILADLVRMVEQDLSTQEPGFVEPLRLSGSVMLEMPGVKTREDSVVPGLAQQALADVGLEVSLTGWTAACEGGFVAHATQSPTIIVGPGDINNQAHQPNESVEIDDLLVAARAYALMAVRLQQA